MKQLSCEKLGCTVGGIYNGTIFYADDIVLLGASACKMQKMIDICYKYGNKYGNTLNPAKKWICTNICNSVSFDINGAVIQNVGFSVKYFSVDLIVYNNVLTIDVEYRIRKFNMSTYVLLNASDSNEVIRCELIVKKFLSILIYMELVVFQLLIVTFTNYTLLIEKYTDIFFRCRYVPVFQTY